MKIRRLRANHYKNPMGYDLSDLSLSWVAESDQAKRQKNARVRIATSPDMRKESIVHDSAAESGQGSMIDSRSYQPGLILKPRTRYFWDVEVEGDNGERAVSEKAWFETGKLKEPWCAKWITAKLPADVHPYVRKSFTIDSSMEEIISARVYISAAGIYELYIDGRKVSNEYLLPGSHAYDYWMQYQTFDVTKALLYQKEKEHVLGVMLGKGWFSGRFGLGNTKNGYGDRMAVLCELVITKKDGSTIVIGTDESWESHAGPVTESSIYDGEHYDARLEVPNWCEADGVRVQNGDEQNGTSKNHTALWEGVEPISLHIGPMSERLSPPIEKQQSFPVAEVIQTPKGETVLDFGQNMTGWVELEAALPKGTRVFFQYSEILQDGCFYNENLRSARAEFSYIAGGNSAGVDGKEPETVTIRPHFTFYGFRYVKVEISAPEGSTEKKLPLEAVGLGKENFTAWVIHSTMTPTVQIETSDERVNRLILKAMWGQKGNFLDVPTDCPQRDERMGWTGDAQIFCGTASFFTDTAGFYQKYMRDVREEQLRLNGSVPFVVPSPKVGGIGEGNGSCAWADVAAVIPWTLYLYFGDKTLLAKQYDTMKDWVEYIKQKDEESGGGRLWQTGFHFADWLALDNYREPESSMGGTDCYYVASAYYYYSTKLTADAAEVLGKQEDAKKYRRLQQEIKEAFQKEYFTPNGRIAEHTQTAQVIALFFDLIPEESRGKVVNTLKQMIKENEMHLNTGFVGTPYLCRVLSGNGANDYAYRLLMKEDYPSWLYEVSMGATTIWERWNSVMPDGHLSGTGMNSLNHYAYGSVVEWIIRDICGINPVLTEPGFRRTLIKPQPYGLLTYASMSYDSPCGRYISGWELSEEERLVTVRLTIPFHCTAEVHLPDAAGKTLRVIRSCGAFAPEQTEAGNAVEEVWDSNGSSAVKLLEAGSYIITYEAPDSYFQSLSIDSELKEILASEQGKTVLFEHIPSLAKAIEDKTLPMEQMGDRSLVDLLEMASAMGSAAFSLEQKKRLDEALGKCRL